MNDIHSMASCPQWPIASLLPHAGNMILLDQVCQADDDGITALTTVKPGPYSLADGGLPPWLGLELMAQAVAAWAGCQAKQAGRPIRLGFLLGTRRYDNHTDCLPAGATLTVAARLSLIDANGMAVFECSLHDETRLLAQARLTIYQPADAAALVASS